MEASLVVKAIILNRDLRKLLLIQRSATDASGAGTWEGVGGSIEPGESPEEAILREIREEVGIEDIAIERLAYTSLCHGDEPMLIIAYLCSTQSQAVRLSDEHQAWRWVDKQTCRELLPEAIWQDFERHGVFEQLNII